MKTAVSSGDKERRRMEKKGKTQGRGKPQIKALPEDDRVKHRLIILS